MFQTKVNDNISTIGAETSARPGGPAESAVKEEIEKSEMFLNKMRK